MQYGADTANPLPSWVWVYQNILVPAFFIKWAPIVAEAAGTQSGQDVLDVACGTGVLTREVSNLVGDSGNVTGLDLNPDMLAVATELSPDIDWQNGNAERLPFSDQAFNTVVYQFGLMFFQDRVKAISEMLRVIKPNGKIAVAVYGTLDEIPVFKYLAQLFETHISEEVADLMNEPFCLGDPDPIKTIFNDAGIRNLVIVRKTVRASYSNLDALIDAELKGWIPMYDITVSPDQELIIGQAAKAALSDFIDDTGAVFFDIPALIITGKAE